MTKIAYQIHYEIMMSQHLSLTEAKAKFSELITRVHFGKEKFTITRKGKR
jgi:antitoxin (DNA-binding transcriptional repressor) of toxin-antitoxin stability system